MHVVIYQRDKAKSTYLSVDSSVQQRRLSHWRQAQTYYPLNQVFVLVCLSIMEGVGIMGQRQFYKIIFFNKTYLIEFSTIAGINLARYGDESSKHGFVLTSISHGFRSSSNIKSYPKISKENCFLTGSIFLDTALIVSCTSFLNCGWTVFIKSTFIFT